MLVDRNYGCRVSRDANGVSNSWWQTRSHPWSLTWLRRAVDLRTMATTREAATSLTTVRMSVDLAEVRWKKFLLRAARWDELGSGSTLRLDSMARKWRVEPAARP